MKLKTLEPNARYDMVHGKPSKLEKDNDGSFLYRFNIEPEMEVQEDGKEEIQIGWKCREIRVYVEPSKSNIKKAIIRSVVDESAELAIVNAYNKNVLKIKVDANAVNEYKEYLQFTEDLETMLAADFADE